MKLFYNQDGEVIGMVDAGADIEANMEMENASSITVTDKDIIEKIRNPKIDINHEYLKISDGAVVEKTKKEKDKMDKSKQVRKVLREQLLDEQANS